MAARDSNKKLDNPSEIVRGRNLTIIDIKSFKNKYIGGNVYRENFICVS